MVTITIVTTLLFIITTSYIGYHSVKAWWLADNNHEFVFNFGMGHLILSLSFIVGLLCEFLDLHNFAIFIHCLDTIVFLKILYACLYARVGRKARIYYHIALVFILIPLTLAFGGVDVSSSALQGFQGIQIIGYYPLDISFELTHAFLALIISIVVISESYFIYIEYGYLLIAISELIQVYNIHSFTYSNSALFQVEWGLAVAGILFVFLASYNINKQEG